jgi:hypothetical protein
MPRVYDPKTKKNLARKRAEGKTTKGALRCLKRALARRFYRLLAEPPLNSQPALASECVPPRAVTSPPRPASQENIERTSVAPARMMCVT